MIYYLPIGGTGENDKRQNDICLSQSRVLVPGHRWKLATADLEEVFTHDGGGVVHNSQNFPCW